MNDAFTPESLLTGHMSPETAKLVDDYPYGRRVRTQIRYWIETHPKRGDRFVSQTVNPNTGRWNNPKPSTYAPVMAMYLDEKGHVTYVTLREWAKQEWIDQFMAVAGEHLNPHQRHQVATIVGLNRAVAGVEFSVRTRPATDEERAADAAAERQLARAVAVHTRQAAAELDGGA